MQFTGIIVSPLVKQKMLILHGPSGSGKTATLRVLAMELNVEIVEWFNPVNENILQSGELLFRGGLYISIRESLNNSIMSHTRIRSHAATILRVFETSGKVCFFGTREWHHGWHDETTTDQHQETHSRGRLAVSFNARSSKGIPAAYYVLSELRSDGISVGFHRQ